MSDEVPANRQAAKYRTRLRDAEKQRDDYANRVEALLRGHVQTLLTVENISAEAFWSITELSTLLGEDGQPDPHKVKAAAQTARDSLGIKPGLYVPAEGRLPTNTPRPRFGDAFTPPR